MATESESGGKPAEVTLLLRWTCPRCGSGGLAVWYSGETVPRSLACLQCGETVPAVDALGQPLPEVAP